MSNDQVLLSASIAVISAFLGIFIGWIARRGRSEAELAAAVSEARSVGQAELATLTERSTSLAAIILQERQQHAGTQQALDACRAQLDTASNEIARLTERARRVPELEAELATAEASKAAREAELLQVSTTNGQNSERATQLGHQVEELTADLASAQRRGDELAADLQKANEARAGLEQQAFRVPGLERQVSETTGLLESAREEFSQSRETSSKTIARLTAELTAEREALAQSRQEGSAAKVAAAIAEAKVSDLMAELAELRTRAENEKVHSAEKLQMLVEARDALSAQFKALANEILEEKSKRFAEQNQVSLGQLLEPLKTQLTEFKGKVEEVYVQEGKDRTALSEQVRQLVTLNQTLSDDAKNLTMALKGQAKTQGNWGELILERVLEASGLRKGFEYKVQDSQTREDGSRAQPDVVIELPEDRKLVVDAKVSLVAYERYVSADSDEARAVAIKQHLVSVREHIRGLSDKNYHQLYGLQSMDFVLAFVPVEPAFMMAVSNDTELFMDAWQRNVLLVSPSTLLFVVRTVAHLWRQEAQSRNAQDIAKRGAQLYDKLVGFAEDLQKVGDRINQAKASFDNAHSKLVSGNGNVIRQAEMLKGLGVKPTKALPKKLVEDAGIDEELSLQTSESLAPMQALQASGDNQSVGDADQLPD